MHAFGWSPYSYIRAWVRRILSGLRGSDKSPTIRLLTTRKRTQDRARADIDLRVCRGGLVGGFSGLALIADGIVIANIVRRSNKLWAR